MVSKSKIFKKTKDKENNPTKIKELIGKLFEEKLSKTIPPIIQNQMVFKKPNLKAKIKTKIKIKLGLKKIFKLGIKIIEQRITNKKVKKGWSFIYLN